MSDGSTAVGAQRLHPGAQEMPGVSAGLAATRRGARVPRTIAMNERRENLAALFVVGESVVTLETR